MSNVYKSDENPIFIAGTPRSGTTLTAKVLGRHSRIFMPGETHFFEDVYSRRGEFGPLDCNAVFEDILHRLSTLYGRYNEPQDQERIDNLFCNTDVKEIFSKCKSYKDILSCFMQIQQNNEGKKRWGNNTPRDIFSIEEIITFYPDAKIIICVRDNRDFLLSYKNKWRATIEENVDRIKSLYHPVITSLLWKSSVKQISRIKHLVPSKNLFVLKYEFLVKRPEQAVKQLCLFIEENYESDMLNIDYQNSSFKSKAKGFYTESVGRWRKRLSLEETFITQLICGSEMIHLGYEKRVVNGSLAKSACIFLSTPAAFISAIRANRSMRGSLFDYIERRLFPLFLSKR